MNAVIKSIVAILVVLTVVFYGGAYLLPGAAQVTRSAEIAAPPDRVFAVAADLRRLPEWSPWAEADPKTVFTVEGGGEAGPGQKLRWASNNPLVGNGTLTVVEHVPPERVALAADYGEFGTSSWEMSFAPAAGGTMVTWRFRSELPGVIDRWAGLMIDRSVGAEYEKGLRMLKRVVEGQPASSQY